MMMSLDSDVSSTEDEFSLLEDMYGSSETSSLNNTEEQLESDQLSGWTFPIAALNYDRTVEQKMTEKDVQPRNYSQLCHTAIGDILSEETLSEDQPVNDTLASCLRSFQPLKVDHQCNLPSINTFSMNLILTRSVLLQQTGMKGEKCKVDHAQTLPYFKFSTVEDPCKVYMDKLPTNSICISTSSYPLDSCASTHGNQNNEYEKIGHRNEDGLVDVPKYCFDASLDEVDHKQYVSTDASGGSMILDRYPST